MVGTSYSKRLRFMYNEKFERNLKDVVNQSEDMESEHVYSEREGDTFVDCHVMDKRGKVPDKDDLHFCPFCGWEIEMV